MSDDEEQYNEDQLGALKSKFENLFHICELRGTTTSQTTLSSRP